MSNNPRMIFFFREATENDRPNPPMSEENYKQYILWAETLEEGSSANFPPYFEYITKAQKNYDEFQLGGEFRASIPVNDDNIERMKEVTESKPGFIRWEEE